jgi:predicted RNA binding protein YcfA (HicA-like mRNA interferase family)
MKVRELLKMIETDGWYLVRTRGDIVSFTIQPNLAQLPLPVSPA